MKNRNIEKNILSIMIIVGILVPAAIFAAGGGYGNGGGMGKGMNGNGGGGNGNQSVSLNISEMPVETLSEKEKEGLMYMLEEEKLARDVYQKLGEKYDINVFKNIPNSEQKHIDAVRELAEKYDLEYQTVNDNNIGVFENATIQKLYTDLIAKGETSLVDALEVGATIEDVDIYDLNEFLHDVDNADIEKVFQYLIMGSENHLRAFNKQLIKNGQDSYKAQYISQEEVDEILAGENNHGNVQGSGNSNQGQGIEKAIEKMPESVSEKMEQKEAGFFGKMWRFFTGWFN